MPSGRIFTGDYGDARAVSVNENRIALPGNRIDLIYQGSFRLQFIFFQYIPAGPWKDHPRRVVLSVENNINITVKSTLTSLFMDSHFYHLVIIKAKMSLISIFRLDQIHILKRFNKRK